MYTLASKLQPANIEIWGHASRGHIQEVKNNGKYENHDAAGQLWSLTKVLVCKELQAFTRKHGQTRRLDCMPNIDSFTQTTSMFYTTSVKVWTCICDIIDTFTFCCWCWWKRNWASQLRQWSHSVKRPQKWPISTNSLSNLAFHNPFVSS